MNRNEVDYLLCHPFYPKVSLEEMPNVDGLSTYCPLKGQITQKDTLQNWLIIVWLLLFLNEKVTTEAQSRHLNDEKVSHNYELRSRDLNDFLFHNNKILPHNNDFVSQNYNLLSHNIKIMHNYEMQHNYYLASHNYDFTS